MRLEGPFPADFDSKRLFLFHPLRDEPTRMAARGAQVLYSTVHVLHGVAPTRLETLEHFLHGAGWYLSLGAHGEDNRRGKESKQGSHTPDDPFGVGRYNVPTEHRLT